jgi:hypothetical protein
MSPGDELLLYVNQVAAFVADLDPRVGCDGTVAWIDIPVSENRWASSRAHFHGGVHRLGPEEEAAFLRRRACGL